MATFNDMMALAEMMAANELLPEHLRGKRIAQKLQPFSQVQRTAICLNIVSAAMTLDTDPFQLANHTYVVHGKLDYDGQAYGARANSCGLLDEALSGEITGTGGEKLITIRGRIKGEAQPRYAELRLVDAQTRDRDGGVNSQWEDEDQMLHYAGNRRWVRRHIPEAMMKPADKLRPAPVDIMTAPTLNHKASPTSATPAIESRPEPVNWAQLIQDVANKDDCPTLSERIMKSDLPKEEKNVLNARLRAKYKELNAVEKVDIAEASKPSEAFRRWERSLKTETDEDRRMEMVGAIDDDDSLTTEEKNALASMHMSLSGV